MDYLVPQLYEKLDELNHELLKVKRANSKLKNEVRSLRREKEQWLKEKRKGQKQHYKNGKRGTQLNG